MESDIPLEDATATVTRDKPEEILDNNPPTYQTSSLKGVVYILNKRNPILSCFTLIMGCFLFAGCSVTLILMVKDYSEYNFIQSSQILHDYNAPFPSITFCNLRPISGDGQRIILKHKLKRPKTYIRQRNKLGIKYLWRKGKKQDYSIFTSELSLSTYLENLPNFISPYQLGHSLEQFVIDCQVTVENYSSKYLFRCTNKSDDVIWRKLIHPTYLNCYTLQFNDTINERVTKVEVQLHLREDSLNASMGCLDCFQSNIRSQLSGALVTLSSPDNYPNIDDEGQYVSSGFLTEFRLQPILRQRKLFCSKNIPVINSINNYTLSQSLSACKAAFLQQQINRKCRCIAIDYPIIKQSQLPYCSTQLGTSVMNQNNKNDCLSDAASQLANNSCQRHMNQTLRRITCKNYVINNYMGDSMSFCRVPCTEFDYSTKRHKTKWPTKSWQSINEEGLYKRGKITIVDEVNSPSENLKQNLLSIIFVRPNYQTLNIHEIQTIKLPNFIGQIGGLLSLWLGFSLISVVELFLVIRQVIINFKRS